ncbi:MAG: hypothetical protein WEA56_06930 [Balneolaceae bacterium]
MAKIDYSPGLPEFAAAATAVALTTGRKLSRNFRYYRNRSENVIHRDELVALCRSIRQDAFGLQNMIMNENDEKSPFLVSVSGLIYDQLEELHRKLLFFEAGSISEIIPLIDDQRRFWQRLTQPDFYSETLLHELEYNIPCNLEIIEQQVQKLPVHVKG